MRLNSLATPEVQLSQLITQAPQETDFCGAAKIRLPRGMARWLSSMSPTALFFLRCVARLAHDKATGAPVAVKQCSKDSLLKRHGSRHKARLQPLF